MDIVVRLMAPSERNEALPLNELQALFIEAAEEIEYLRALLEPFNDHAPVGIPPRGRA